MKGPTRRKIYLETTNYLGCFYLGEKLLLQVGNRAIADQMADLLELLGHKVVRTHADAEQ